MYLKFFFNICFILFHEYWKHWSQYWECLKLDFQGAFYSLHSSRSKRGQNTSGNGPNEALGVGDGQGSLGAAVHGVANSQTRLSDWTELKHHINVERFHFFTLSKSLISNIPTWNIHFYCSESSQP